MDTQKDKGAVCPVTGKRRNISSGIGGQAVMEGIMMRNRDDYSVAVRKSDGSILVKKEKIPESWRKPFFRKIGKIFFIRGIFSFVFSLVIGNKALNYSSNVYANDVEEDEEEEMSRFEQWLTDKLGDKAEKVISAIVMFLAILLALGLFVLLPSWIGHALKSVLPARWMANLAEGVIRVVIFIAYVRLIGCMQEIKRLYMFHGAEHKCINCIESGLPLTPENVKKSSKEHKRCGTSFLLYVMVISVLLFMVIDVEGFAARLISRILLIPVIAGLAFEFIQFAGNTNNPIMNALSRPGLWLQGLTTTEPGEEMILTGIASVEAVFDWRAYLLEHFGLEVPYEEVKKEATDEENVYLIPAPDSDSKNPASDVVTGQ